MKKPKQKHSIKSQEWQKKIRAMEKKAGHPICGAKNRSGLPCRRYPMDAKERCYYHGGTSTGIKTKKGRERQRKVATKHGAYSRYKPFSREEEAFIAGFMEKWKKQDFRYRFSDDILRDTIIAYIIQIGRGLKWSKERGKHWDFSRMGDALLRSLREMKLTPLSRTEAEGLESQTDLFIAFRKRIEKLQSEENG